MSRQVRLKILGLAVIGPLVALASQALAEPVNRSNWAPNVGDLIAEGEQPLGDLWTFKCPRGGTVSASVDTKDDTDASTSNLDPVLEIVDGAGNLLASGDDEVDCTYPPVCGFQCPAVLIPCGEGGIHSLIVRDASAVDNSGVKCEGGGGYELFVEVFARSGESLSEKRVALGGGPKRKVPDFALELGKGPTGPALDDENVPFGSELVTPGCG